ncbi:MAG: hypothetical protein ACTSRW_11385 [Candidatus Helarchaeota archaeon]
MEKPREEFTRAEKLAFILTIISAVAFQILACMTFDRLVLNWLIIALLDIVPFVAFISVASITGWMIKRKGKIKNYRIEAEDRGLLFISGIGGLVGLFFLYVLFEWSMHLRLSALKLYVFTYIIVYLIDAVVTLLFKYRTSMHMSGATCAITSIFLTMLWLSPLYALEFLFLPLVAWSRWKVKGHTIPQLISGTIIGFLTTLVTYCFSGTLFFI